MSRMLPEPVPFALDLGLVGPTVLPTYNMRLAKHQRMHTSPLFCMFLSGGRGADIALGELFLAQFGMEFF